MLGLACCRERCGAVIAHENARETLNYLCDARRPTRDMRFDFEQHVCFADLREEDPLWAEYERQFGDQTQHALHRESADPAAIHSRLRDLFQWLDDRFKTKAATVTQNENVLCVWGRPRCRHALR